MHAALKCAVQAIMYLYAKEQQSGFYTSKKRFFMKRLGIISAKRDAKLAKHPAAPARTNTKAAAALAQAKACSIQGSTCACKTRTHCCPCTAHELCTALTLGSSASCSTLPSSVREWKCAARSAQPGKKL